MTNKIKVRVLMVDDQEPPAREISRELRDLSDSSGFEFEFKHVYDIKGYHNAIVDSIEPFDVLVADLKLTMEQQDLVMGVEQTVSWHLLHSPNTIVIVYSVFTSSGFDELSSAIDACVAAMRAGAASCIRKTVGSTTRLTDTIINELRRRIDPDIAFDTSWWTENANLLIKKYGGKAIAIEGKNIIASADTIPDLREQLRGMNGHMLRVGYPRILLVPDNFFE